jgi:hypothetical protein
LASPSRPRGWRGTARGDAETRRRIEAAEDGEGTPAEAPRRRRTGALNPQLSTLNFPLRPHLDREGGADPSRCREGNGTRRRRDAEMNRLEPEGLDSRLSTSSPIVLSSPIAASRWDGFAGSDVQWVLSTRFPTGERQICPGF